MSTRSVGFGAAAALVLALAGGCKKSSSDNEAANRDPQPQAPKTEPFESVATVHWVGTEKLAQDTNASHFLELWNLPEGIRLENQTLDKLAEAIVASLSATNTQAAAAGPRPPLAFPAPTNPAPPTTQSPSVRLLRPLLADLVKKECYFEIGAATNEPGEVIFAAHLKSEAARLWETNLTAALDLIVGSHSDTTNSGRVWTLAMTNSAGVTSRQPAGQKSGPGPGFRSIQLDRAGEWTVVGLTSGPHTVMDLLLTRIRNEGTRFGSSLTNYWVETSFDLAGIGRLLSLAWELPGNFPKVKATIAGESENVRSRGELEFPKGLPTQLPAWIIPTNLVHDPVIGFSAIRGVSSLLKSLPVWNKLKLSTAPDQVFTWSQVGMPTLEYVAAPWAGASNVVRQASEPILSIANPWLATKSMGHLTASAGSSTIIWESAPFVTPRLTSVSDEQGEFVFAGLVPILRTNSPLPPELLKEFTSDTNRVYYSWEITAPKLEQLQYVGQLFRLICRLPQLPPESAGVQWLNVAGPRMGNCVTVASLSGPNRVSFTRKSTLGMDSLELHLLADWLESPSFPRGLHTTLTPAPAFSPNPVITPR